MATKVRKRAPGGGRKPKASVDKKAGWLQARITDGLRLMLEHEAARNGRSMSQEAQLRLQQSFELPAKLQREWGPRHIKALAQLVSRVARAVEMGVGADPGDAGDLAWHRNAFTHAAVSTAIAAILEGYKPVGLIQTPIKVEKGTEWAGERAEHYRTPESVGHGCALGLFDQIASTPEPPPLPPPAGAHYAEGYYIFPDIRKILGEPKK